MTAALCLPAYLVSRRRLFAYAGAAFFFYFLMSRWSSKMITCCTA